MRERTITKTYVRIVSDENGFHFENSFDTPVEAAEIVSKMLSGNVFMPHGSVIEISQRHEVDSVKLGDFSISKGKYAEISEAIENEKKIRAIKIFRDVTGASLKESKVIIDSHFRLASLSPTDD